MLTTGISPAKLLLRAITMDNAGFPGSEVKEMSPVRQRLKQFLLIAAAFGALYFFSAYHIVIHENDFTLLEKPYLTLEYTFVSLNKRDAEDVLSEDLLREAGIGEILVDLGELDEGQRQELEIKFDSMIEE